MDINKENVDELNALLKVRVTQEDYEDQVDKVLKDYRKRARIDGFRPGKVPAGLIRKMYRKPVMIEEINKVVLSSVREYLKEEKIRILGEPLPDKEKQADIDWDNQQEFEFVFDLGLAPEFELEISQKDKIPYYEIKVDDKMIENQKENYKRRFGTFDKIEKATGNEIVKGKMEQTDPEGNPVEEGIRNDEAVFSLELMKDKDAVKKFVGKGSGDVVDFDVKKAYPNEQEVASLLKIDKDQVKEIQGDFRVTIQEINRFKPAELNSKFYDQIFGKDQIKTNEEFTQRVIEEIKFDLSRQSNSKFAEDVKAHFLDKTGLKLPAEFLKRWITVSNNEKFSEEQIEKDYPAMEDDLKWQLIREKIVRDKNIRIEENEVREYAREYARMYFQQYGMGGVPEEHLNNYADKMLNDQNEKRRIHDTLADQKIVEFVRENAGVDVKEVSAEKFEKIMQKNA